MLRTPIYSIMLLLAPATALAQVPSPDSQTTQVMLAEIRQLRNDLQTTAATIQRVQIVMYRLQSQAGALDRATQRLAQARGACNMTQQQRKNIAYRIEQAEATKLNAQNPAGQKVAEEMLSNLKLSGETLVTDEQQCQLELAGAENQIRAEEAKMNDFQQQLDKLDRVLAGYASK